MGLARLKVFAFLAFISGTLMHRLTGVKPDARGELPEDPWQKDLAVQSLKKISILANISIFTIL